MSVLESYREIEEECRRRRARALEEFVRDQKTRHLSKVVTKTLLLVGMCVFVFLMRWL